MKLHFRGRCEWLAVVCVAVLAAQTGQAKEAGTVIFAAGPVNVQRVEMQQPLAKGDAVLVGDVIITGDGGRVQLLMTDEARVAIRPNSQFEIEEYALAEAAEPVAAAPAVTEGETRAIMRLIKGGFRTITGLIGKDDETDYEVRTPVGTLGIRGTAYAAVFCLGDCDWAPGPAPGASIADGLYLGVTADVLVFRNELREIEIERGEFAFIPVDTREPRILLEAPSVLMDSLDLIQPETPAPPPDAAGLDGEFDDELGDRREPPPDDADRPDAPPGEPTEPPGQSIIGIDEDGNPVDLTPGQPQRPPPPPPQQRTIDYSTGPLGGPGALGFSGTRDNQPAEYMVDANGDLIGFLAPYPDPVAPVIGTFDIGSSANVETGADSVTLMRWGRWAGGIASIRLPGPIDASQDLSAQSLHWIAGPETMAPPAIPQTGMATYNVVGATTPTDNAGNSGVLVGATFMADFVAQTVNNSVTVDINAQTWQADGIVPIGPGAQNTDMLPHQFGGNYTNVSIGGVPAGFGSFTGFFAEPGSSVPGVPGGAGLTYILHDMPAQEQVSGAVVFGNPAAN